MPKFRVLKGKSFGLHQAGEIVEHEAKDAAPYIGTHLELVTGEEAKVPPGGAPFGPARFADMNVEETLSAAKQLTPAERDELLAWERANKKRQGVITPLGNWNS